MELEKKSVFKKRVAFKPFEYPEVIKFVDAISHSYWLFTEFNYTSDVDDFHTKLNDSERNTIKNCLLAIAQIEISVKTFWGDLYRHFPKPEFNAVGASFAESEIRHSFAYSHLLEILGFNDEFTIALQEPCIQGRVDYLSKYLKNAGSDNKEFYTLTLALFSLFIENVSLFSQFLIVKSFNKERNLLKGVDNVIQATQREECYIEGTEVLTPNGWRLISDMNIDDEVYQYNEDRSISLVKVGHTTSSYFEGDLLKIGTKKHYCIVTPEHDMVYFNPKGDLLKKKAFEFRGDSKKMMPNSGTLSGGITDKLSYIDKLRIAIQADGSKLYWINKAGEIKDRGINSGYNYKISLTKERKKSRLESILDNLDITYSKEIDNKDPREVHYKLKMDLAFDYKYFDWVDPRDKTSNWCREFALELKEWDGFNKPPTAFGYCSTEKSNVDVAHYIGVLAGYLTSISKHVDNRKESYKDTYKVTFMTHPSAMPSHGHKKQTVKYKGNVSCITVPSGMIVTRYDDNTYIAGNCVHALFGTYLVNLVKEEQPEWFNDEFYSKVERACRKAYEAEVKIIDWIFEKGEMPFLPKEYVIEFIKDRFNQSMKMIHCKEIFITDQTILDKLEWFNVETTSEVHTDFFHKTPVNYNKKSQSITANDLF